ncbi:hypothetical protein ACWIG5_30520 [Streptomyces lydicus]
MTGDREKEQRVQAALRRHVRTSAFAETEKAISFMLPDPQMQKMRTRIKAAQTQIGKELRSRLRPFQHRYEQTARDGDTARPTLTCPGKHSRRGHIYVLDHGHETSRKQPHWSHNSESRPIP